MKNVNLIWVVKNMTVKIKKKVVFCIKKLKHFVWMNKILYYY